MVQRSCMLLKYHWNCKNDTTLPTTNKKLEVQTTLRENGKSHLAFGARFQYMAWSAEDQENILKRAS